MATRAQNQITIVDLTDAYAIMLSMDAVSLNGSTSTLGSVQSVTVNVTAFRGSQQLTPSVGTPSCPSNVSASVGTAVDMAVPVTITFAAALTAAGRVTIPVSVEDVTISKEFSYAIAFRGAAGSSVSVTKTEYQAGASNTSAPTGSWSTSPVAVSEGSYLWTRVTYSDGKTAYSVAKQGVSGTNGSSVTVSGVAYAYQLGSSGTTPPTGTWSTSPVAPTTSKFAWTRTTTTYSDGTAAVTYTVGGKTGVNGTNATAYTLIASAMAIRKSESGAYTPASLVLTGRSQTGSAAMTDYAGRFKIETTADGSTWSAAYSSSANEATKSYAVPAGITALRVSLYAAGGTSTLLDQYIIPVVTDGASGEDAIVLVIVSSAGTIFKNTAIATTLTAHVYKGGAELSGSALSALGTIKWYKDGGSTAVATGATLSISAGDVSNKAVYEATLEG